MAKKVLTMSDIDKQEVVDVINNLKESLYWLNRVNENGAEAISLPSDKYDYPDLAAMSVTQAIEQLRIVECILDNNEDGISLAEKVAQEEQNHEEAE